MIQNQMAYAAEKNFYIESSSNKTGILNNLSNNITTNNTTNTNSINNNSQVDTF